MFSERSRHPIIFVLGPPGSGKSYLCTKAIGEVGGVEHVVMSDLLRKEAQKPTSPFANEINTKLPKGILVSSDAAIAALRSYLDLLSEDISRRILLDGFPRNLDQAEKFFEEIGEVMGTIELTCDWNTVQRRLKQRNRSDDDQATAKRRYDSHVDETVPMINAYLMPLRQHTLCKVDSEKDGEEGCKQFREAIKHIIRQV